MLNRAFLQASICRPVGRDRETRDALRLYRGACSAAWLSRIPLLTAPPRHLLDLETVRSAHAVRGSHYIGVRAVPIRQICGSEGRCTDFDASFRPLNIHNKCRWLSVAAVRLRGVSLPPVELIQVGADYFVRDGHHRISVARAMGQDYIDAEVTVWESDRPS